MNNIIKRTWNQNRMVNIEDLRGMAFQAESGGHTFEISGIDDQNNAVELSGTVAGVFMRPDNADIAVAGEASDGVVSVTLPEDCYTIPGRFALTIFVTSDGQKTAVYAAIGTVSRTSGGAVAGDTPQDVVDLINQIQAAVASIPADYTDLMAAIAPNYSPSALYAFGSYAWYNGNLYRCTTAITTAETWTAAHWIQSVFSDDVTKIHTDYNSLRLKAYGDASEQYAKKFNTTAGTGISATYKIMSVSIQNGQKFTIKVAGPSNLIDGATMTFYRYDAQGHRTSIGSTKAVNTLYIFIATADIYGIGIYCAGAHVVGSGTLELQCVVQVASNNQLSVGNIESGQYVDGTGKPKKLASYCRTVDPIICKAGTVIQSTYNFNPFEYDIVTGEYIRDNGGWTKFYTVVGDCALKLTFQTQYTNKAAIIDNTIVTPTQTVLTEISLPVVNLAKNIKVTTKNFLQSDTVRSIAHRGDYLWCQGMMCGASAVIAAKRAGYRASENDVALTADGKFVMWHDTTLAAIGDSTHGVGDYTLAELKAMDFGSAFGSQFAGEKILTFAEWILVCKQVGVDAYIDFKVTGDTFTNAMAEELVSTIRQYGMLDHVSYLANANKIRLYHPNARLCLLATPTQELVTLYTPLLQGGEVAFNPKSTALTSDNAVLALNNGFSLECWHVDYALNGFTTENAILGEIERVVGLGVQGITLDAYRVEDAFNAKYGLL